MDSRRPGSTPCASASRRTRPARWATTSSNRIGQAARLVEAAPGGGARFPVVVLLAGREYGRFHVDVGLGPPPHGVPERLAGDDLLAFAGLPPAVALAVPREMQFAEKIHAYTRPWDDRVNTRTKDLVDLLLLV